ncbi:FtsW/RodA/SpoVE family cell cycle protein [Micrococcus lylae]|uniref:FtsW/RodA/SpoVE family cell cycle protein n=1 Tax=Micrococcus TaxID=1269 RepID=UPI0008A3E0DB|nr:MULTISPECIES: putative peptidoglycan glycosyltransferase FtsW [Micrococcus]OFR90160.1 cell division protein FtsW [Micrococcus sp. HMSC067E09]WIK83082.1 putative peptidoglycan glycosyltransferase FtsW [Micrococcus lylae]
MPTKTSGGLSPVKHGLDRMWAALEGRRMLDMTVLMIAGSTAVLTVLGLVMVLSSSSVEAIGSGGSYSLFLRQALWACVGMVMLTAATFTPVPWIRRMAWPALAVSVVLLGLVAFTPLGVNVGGNTNWLRIGSFTAQPSELAKLSLALWGGAVIARKGRLVNQVKHALVPVVFPGGVLVLGLIMWGRDLGTAIIVALVLAAVLWVGGAHRIVFMVTAGLAALLTIGLTLFASHRMLRVQAWLGVEAACDDPSDPCFQPAHGLYALASGGWWGVGLGQSRQKWSYIPEAENDFIFTILGEELGLLGTLLVIGLFAILALGMYRVAAQTRSTFIRVATWGIITWFVGQTFLNAGMVSGLLPVVGVPLPFISYGGSALTLAMTAVGVVLSFARHERRLAHLAAQQAHAASFRPIDPTPAPQTQEA